MDQQITSDIETLLNIARPKLLKAYRNGDAQMYHNVSEEFIHVANRIFMHLQKNSDITWFEFKALGSSLCNSFFWKYTDLVHSFCDYLELRNKE